MLYTYQKWRSFVITQCERNEVVKSIVICRENCLLEETFLRWKEIYNKSLQARKLHVSNCIEF